MNAHSSNLREQRVVNDSGNRAIPLFKVFMSPRDELIPALESVLYSGQISEGAAVTQFERSFGDFVGQKNILSFYSGTAALHAALVLSGVEPGDEVISTAMTAEPTNLAILQAGAKPVWADVDPYTGNIDPASVALMTGTRTKAIMAVHYGGVPVDLTPLRAVARSAGIPVIEDAAHALGATYEGELIGAHSEYVMYSLQAIKHMTTVDGGMLVCRNPDDLGRGRRFRWFGMDRTANRTELDVSEIGWKYHMNNVNATIGEIQLRHAQAVISRHIKNGIWFDENLDGISGLQLLRIPERSKPSYWFYTVLADRRDDLSRMLTSRGIGNSLAHKRNDRHSIFSSASRPLPGLDYFYSRMLHIPCGWWVSDSDREYIATALKSGW